MNDDYESWQATPNITIDISKVVLERITHAETERKIFAAQLAAERTENVALRAELKRLQEKLDALTSA